MNKTLICYAYCENQNGPTKTKNSFSNLKFFLDIGLVKNKNYDYYINISGKYKFNFDNYIKNNNKLYILNIFGLNAWNSWKNILNNININDYKYFIFLKDKIRGPYNIVENWIDYFINNLNNNVLISGYGTSPLGKLYYLPYIADKFICLEKNVLQILLNNNIFNKYTYDCKEGGFEIKTNKIEQSVEIKLSKLLLDNNIEYVVLDKNGILNLDILKYYKEKNWDKLFEITKNLHKINDTTIKNRLFWTDSTMKEIFENKNKNLIKKLNKPRDTSKLEKWS